MPALQLTADVVGVLADGLGRLPGPLQTLVVSAALIAIAWGPIVGTFAALAGVIGTLGPLLAGLGAVIAGFISWPVLLVAGLVAAGVAIFAFRDQIGAFFGWLVSAAAAAFNLATQVAYRLWVEPFVKMWDGMKVVATAFFRWLPTGWRAFSTWVMGVFAAIGSAFSRLFVQPVTSAFAAVVNTGKAALRALLGWVIGAVNRVIGAINTVIAGYNRLPAPDLPLIPYQSVPAFAQGGFVSQPTLGWVGEAGREYIVPEAKAAGFAQNFLAGARGAAAIPSTGGTSSSGPVTVNLTTGPLQQLPDGRGGVAIEDVERLVRQGVTETIRQLRTPAGRYAMGVR
jgi:hypothetical protein